MSEHVWQTVAAWASQPQLLELGAALMHFLWQGAIVALLLATALSALRRRSANLRYMIACAALVSMAACPVATFVWSSQGLPANGGADAAPLPMPKFQSQRVAVDPSRDEMRVEAPPVRIGRNAVAATPPAPRSFAGIDLVSLLRPFAPWMVALWLMGVVALSVRLCVGWVEVQQMRCRGVQSVPPGWEERLAQIA
ncbi:MAG TPA: hypothetical protein VHB77_19545, partial [Planctomycetaceae bacterium]|nr:hypothetical protein [Planctomycetaceae bacterium]